MSEAQETHERHKLGPVLATVLVAGNMVGSGVYLLPATLASIGSISLLGWIASTVGALLLAGVFSILARVHPTTEGITDYARVGLGRFFGFQAGLIYWVTCLVGDVAIAVAVTGYLTVFLPVLAQPWSAAVSNVVVIWLLTLLNIVGARFAAKVGGATLALGLLPVIGVALAGWLWFDPEVFAHAWNVSGKPALAAAQSSLVLVFWAYLGLESATVAAAVVRRPERNVPIAALGGVVLASIVYILACVAISGILPARDLAASNAPFAAVTARALGAGAAAIVAVCALIKASGTLTGWLMVTAETTRASAVLGHFPRWLARTRADGAPVPALIVLAALMSLIAVLTVSPTLARQFGVLINVAVVLSMVIYALCALALVRLARAIASPRVRLAARACAAAGFCFSVWVIATSEPGLLGVSAAVVVATVVLWLALIAADKARAKTLPSTGTI